MIEIHSCYLPNCRFVNLREYKTLGILSLTLESCDLEVMYSFIPKEWVLWRVREVTRLLSDSSICPCPENVPDEF